MLPAVAVVHYAGESAFPSLETGSAAAATTAAYPTYARVAEYQIKLTAGPHRARQAADDNWFLTGGDQWCLADLPCTPTGYNSIAAPMCLTKST